MGSSDGRCDGALEGAEVGTPVGALVGDTKIVKLSESAIKLRDISATRMRHLAGNVIDTFEESSGLRRNPGSLTF